MAKNDVKSKSPKLKAAPTAGAQTAGRALKLMKILVAQRAPISLTEMAEKAELDISATYRMMRELEVNSFADREPDGKRYIIGGELIALASVILSKVDVRIAARPVLQRLVALTGETAMLNLRDSYRRITVDGVESTQPVRRVIPFGETMPLYATPSGWTMLSFLPESDMNFIIGEAEANGIKAAKLRKLVSSIRQQGYVMSGVERGVGHSVLAAPIFSSGGIMAAITISGPHERWNAEVAEPYISKFLQQCRILSASLGHHLPESDKLHFSGDRKSRPT